MTASSEASGISIYMHLDGYRGSHRPLLSTSTSGHESVKEGEGPKQKAGRNKKIKKKWGEGKGKKVVTDIPA